MGIVSFHIINGIIYSIILAVILLLSIKINPRMWLHRYPKSVTNKVSNKTDKEKKQFLISGIIFMVVILGYPIVSTIYLMNYFEIDSYINLVLYIFILFLSFNIMDTFIIDYFLFSRFTVKFIMVKGTNKADYKDYNYHLISGCKGLLFSVMISFILALLIYLGGNI